MKNLIIANWKCNPLTLNEALDIFESAKKQITEKGLKNTEAVICPPFQYIEFLKSDLNALMLGGQDCYSQEKGAFTGEVSALMLKNSGCQYVIIGHSERRKYQKESDELINEKINAALKAGLKPVLCIDQVSQLEIDLKDVSYKEVAVAYEPLWAIGTGKACGIPEALDMNQKIKEVLGKDAIVLYGGSVKSDNARGYIEEAGYNGLLVGGASLVPDEFFKILEGVDLI